MNRKHALIMILCCLIPLAALLAISVFHIPMSSVIFIGLILMCPLMHLLLMRGMMNGHSQDHGQNSGHFYQGESQVKEEMKRLNG